MKKLEIIIASAPDREKIVAEIWYDNRMITELNQETESLKLEFYVNGSPVQIDYDIFLDALIEAKKAL